MRTLNISNPDWYHAGSNPVRGIMQTRPYDSRDGNRVWLNQEDQETLLNQVDEQPKRQIAFSLGLHGLRTDEIIKVQEQHIRTIADDTHSLIVPDGKTGKREVPIDTELAKSIRMTKNVAGLLEHEPIVGVSKRTLRNWISDYRDPLDCEDLGMHDLRRTWATDTFYSLAFEGIPIAEELTMAWGGWAMTATGRETFRENYLGPVPDRIVTKVTFAL